MEYQEKEEKRLKSMKLIRNSCSKQPCNTYTFLTPDYL